MLVAKRFVAVYGSPFHHLFPGTVFFLSSSFGFLFLFLFFCVRFSVLVYGHLQGCPESQQLFGFYAFQTLILKPTPLPRGSRALLMSVR
jgi:hypothetical protein